MSEQKTVKVVDVSDELKNRMELLGFHENVRANRHNSKWYDELIEAIKQITNEHYHQFEVSKFVIPADWFGRPELMALAKVDAWANYFDGGASTYILQAKDAIETLDKLGDYNSCGRFAFYDFEPLIVDGGTVFEFKVKAVDNPTQLPSRYASIKDMYLW